MFIKVNNISNKINAVIVNISVTTILQQNQAYYSRDLFTSDFALIVCVCRCVGLLIMDELSQVLEWVA